MLRFTLLISLLAAPIGQADDEIKAVLSKELQRSWKLAFEDDCLGSWKDKWFLDGIKARVTNDQRGMTIDTAKGYAVLWTDQEFQGDLRIEYDFRRVDSNDKGVNIIYIQAQGKGTGEFDRDIRRWSDKRQLAAMKNYFNNMDTYHISYAAFPGNYIRGRRYLPARNKGLKGTELEGTMKNTGLFKSGKQYHVTIIKREDELLMQIRGANETLACRLRNRDKAGIHAGRIGLRLMPGRESLFSNIRVYELNDGPQAPALHKKKNMPR